MMGDISEHFSRSEFACRCGCGFDKIDPRVVALAEQIRALFGKPVTVNSGCRCQRHNAAAKDSVVAVEYKLASGKRDLDKYPRGVPGGPKDSNHTHGTACDIRIDGVPALDLWKKVRMAYFSGKLPLLAGLGKYPSFVHVDVDPVKRGGLREW